MTSTTSQGSPGAGPLVPPLRREVIVDAGPDLAFAVFTERIGRWWPMGDHSVYGAEAEVRFDGSGVGARIVESRAGADDAVWGTVDRWEPGEAISFTWHPGKGPDESSRVVVTFEDVDGKTLVTLVHSGWEIYGDHAVQARESYGRGWPVVMAAFAEHAGAHTGA